MVFSPVVFVLFILTIVGVAVFDVHFDISACPRMGCAPPRVSSSVLLLIDVHFCCALSISFVSANGIALYSTWSSPPRYAFPSGLCDHRHLHRVRVRVADVVAAVSVDSERVHPPARSNRALSDDGGRVCDRQILAMCCVCV